MDNQNKKCADPILEKLGLGHFYHGDKPLFGPLEGASSCFENGKVRGLASVCRTS